MTEEVRVKLKELYDKHVSNLLSVLEVFNYQFGSDLVDCSLCSFEEFIYILDTYTLGTLGITSFKGSNDYGSYNIDPDDYSLKGRGKPFTEYIPDLGIIDYLKPKLENILEEVAHEEGQAYIIIKFPNVRVTNEYDQYTDIRDLYVRIYVRLNGQLVGELTMIRATFSMDEWASDYAHSHLPGISTEFTVPCFGTGPIIRTMMSLNTRCDLNIWGLFAFEIQKYVTVESLTGVPYRRLQSIGASTHGGVAKIDNMNYLNTPPTMGNGFNVNKVREFTKYFLRHCNLQLSYINDRYELGNPPIDAWFKISNIFIEWWNQEKPCSKNYLLDHGVLKEYIEKDGSMYFLRSNRVNLSDNGRSLFMFKGSMVRLRIDDADTQYHTVLLIDQRIYRYVITKMLHIVNYYYGREREEDRTSECEDVSRTFYI